MGGESETRGPRLIAEWDHRGYRLRLVWTARDDAPYAASVTVPAEHDALMRRYLGLMTSNPSHGIASWIVRTGATFGHGERGWRFSSFFDADPPGSDEEARVAAERFADDVIGHVEDLEDSIGAE